MSCRALQALFIAIGLAWALAFSAVRAEDDPQATEALWLADHAKLVHKVKTLVIGDVDLKDVNIDHALEFLRRRTKAFDPEHQGINFVIKNRPVFDGIIFSVKLKHATVENVLGHFPIGRVDIGDFIVELQTGWGDSLYSRTFRVSDNVLAINPSMIIDKNRLIYDVRSLFQPRGIKFAPGESVTYTLPTKSVTVVCIDPEMAIRIDELLVLGFKGVK